MKVVHKDPTAQGSAAWLIKARQLEEQGDLAAAAGAYEKVIKQRPANEHAHDRLMIIYRKEKDYKKERDVINRAIRIFEEAHKTSSKLGGNKKLAAISKSLLRSLDMVDSKGKAVFETEPIKRWKKRKETVEKR